MLSSSGCPPVKLLDESHMSSVLLPFPPFVSLIPFFNSAVRFFLLRASRARVRFLAGFASARALFMFVALRELALAPFVVE